MGLKNICYSCIKDECNEFLASNVDIDHACGVLQTAQDYNMEDLKTKALNFIFDNGRAILDSNDFLNLSAECLALLLNSDNCDAKRNIFTIKWYSGVNINAMTKVYRQRMRM